ncbi:DeoR/GlpR family DNA-binding transcription regulator [Clostridium uliginosum]|uniref:DeoR family transcriptional regulator, deoxyribose operon repressor n=1 Tax=Clostridium uliginosum TaxID=119641 RepID=A0A1I1I483_9CLOT|nr:DeoR/GlpR family DNA-binding transcription regulator [Clostridium uliginosum]SFC28020.1 DeoR family transcriptional regulator, deoxyribose operon repressor [Clostridium uliginosum]
MSKKLERTNKIIEILKEKNGASIKELASTLGVSEMTIRRDLNVLKSNNIVNNVYGATIYNPLNSIQKLDNFYDITNEVVIQEGEKCKIGKVAETLIQTDDIIIIDTGTTTEKLAQNISNDMNLTALFYNTNILMALKGKDNIKLIFAGGYFHPNTQMFESSEGISLIENTRATKVFVSAAGIHEQLGVTCSNNYEVPTKRAIIGSSVEKILLVDSQKFGIVKSSYFADLNEFDVIITDNGISKEWIDRIKNLEIRLIIV